MIEMSDVLATTVLVGPTFRRLTTTPLSSAHLNVGPVLGRVTSGIHTWHQLVALAGGAEAEVEEQLRSKPNLEQTGVTAPDTKTPHAVR